MRDPVFNGILHQRLKDKRRNGGEFHRGFGVEYYLETLAKADLLHLQIRAHKPQFFI